MVNRIIDRLTTKLKRFFQDIIANTQPPQSEPAYKLPKLAGPVHNLGGGGPDVDDAIQWMINQVRGSSNSDHKVNVLVIRAAGSDDYNQLIYRMRGVKYVETLIIRNRQEANRTDIFDKVRNAEVIFFAGGDQCEYIRHWKNTKLEVAIKSVYDKGGAVGGTSAGAMIQSEYVYDSCACVDSIETYEALDDPYRNITFTYNFLLTDPGTYTFKKGEPLFTFFPIERNTVEKFELKESRIEDNPELLKDFKEYSDKRKNFIENMFKTGKDLYQNFYRNGVKANGEKVNIKNHITNLIFGGKRGKIN
jgi:hypothetical protein